eukprot:SAG31_NODE_21797_length_540_cov_1.630385_1_plen_28_part_10
MTYDLDNLVGEIPTSSCTRRAGIGTEIG